MGHVLPDRLFWAQTDATEDDDEQDLPVTSNTRH
jgi:hypothetical protein